MTNSIFSTEDANKVKPTDGSEVYIINFKENYRNDDTGNRKATTFVPFKSSRYSDNNNHQDPSLKLFNHANGPKLDYGSCRYQDKAIDNYLSPEGAKQYEQPVTVSDIVGSFGWFQFFILLFSGLRECAVGYDAVVLSVILKPTENFYCLDQPKSSFTISELNSYANNSEEFNKSPHCYQHIGGHMLRDPDTGEPVRCTSWAFQDQSSLLADWVLVCHRHWLVAFIESAYFMGLMVGNLVWGYYADKIGRRRAYLIAHSINLFFGLLSLLVPHLWMFTICRFFSAFGAISYNIIYSIQVELIGTKHRSYSTLLNHMGWGLGVILVPIANRCLSDYRYMIALAPLLSLLMFPWAFWLPESSRWLMSQERFSEARQELIRAANFNNQKTTPLLEKKISSLRIRIKNDLAKQAENPWFSNKHLYRMLFSNPQLVRNTIVLAYISFSGHLFYYMLTINFGYIENLSIDANFITSGAGEWFSVIIGAVMLKFLTRKTCLSLFLFLMASSFVFQFLIDLNLTPSLETPFIISLNNGIGTISALLVVFVALIVNQEVYPTYVRQTGSSLVNTISESGSTMAPMLIQMSRMIGPASADLLWAAISLSGIVFVKFLSKTDDIDLPDT